jgi:hypothetical protein
MKTITLEFDLAQAYLEMARAHHDADVVGPSGVEVDEVTMTNNTAIALVAHGYIFSFMALNAFASGCLWQVWQMPNSPLKAKYPDARDFKHLLKTRLKELKVCISELYPLLGVEPLDKADPKLWNKMLQVLKITRDFLTHPTPDVSDFNRIIGDAMGKHSWSFPTRIVEQVIGHLLKNQKKAAPNWLNENQEFRFGPILALKVQPKP